MVIVRSTPFSHATVHGLIVYAQSTAMPAVVFVLMVVVVCVVMVVTCVIVVVVVTMKLHVESTGFRCPVLTVAQSMQVSMLSSLTVIVFHLLHGTGALVCGTVHVLPPTW